MKLYQLPTMAMGVAATLVSVALAQQPQQQQAQQGQQQQGQQQQAQQQQGQQADANVDEKFIKEAIRGNLFEVAVAQHVAQQTQNQQVQQFAQKMAEDHSQALQKLRQLAQQLGVQPPNEMNQWQQAMVQHMKGLQGAELDREYMFHQTGAHQIKLLDHVHVISQGSNPQVQQLAEQMVPTLKNHLEMAAQIAQQLARGQAATARRTQQTR